MIRTLLLLMLAGSATIVQAQDRAAGAMPADMPVALMGHDASMPDHAGHAPATDAPAGHGPANMPMDHAGHGAQTPVAAGQAPPTDPHAGHTMPPADATRTSREATASPAASPDVRTPPVPAPPPPSDRYADRFWPAGAMAAARDTLRREHGAMLVGMAMVNIAEWQPASGGDRLRWDGEGWFGGDIHRLTVKTEGEGATGERLETAETQLLYSRAIDAYWNIQAGVRQDLGRGARPTYAVLGIEGLAPYWFEVEGALFISDRGDVSGRVEAYYDQRLTQRLILQPRAELNVALRDMPHTRTGPGLSETSLDLRLRYEIRREFAPYVGVSWERRFGRTRRYARADGEEADGARLVLGLRAWF